MHLMIQQLSVTREKRGVSVAHPPRTPHRSQHRPPRAPPLLVAALLSAACVIPLLLPVSVVHKLVGLQPATRRAKRLLRVSAKGQTCHLRTRLTRRATQQRFSNQTGRLSQLDHSRGPRTAINPSPRWPGSGWPLEPLDSQERICSCQCVEAAALMDRAGWFAL